MKSLSDIHFVRMSFLFLLFGFSSCTKNPDYEELFITGRVTHAFDGKPIAGAKFYGIFGDHNSNCFNAIEKYALTDNNGNFKLSYQKYGASRFCKYWVSHNGFGSFHGNLAFPIDAYAKPPKNLEIQIYPLTAISIYFYPDENLPLASLKSVVVYVMSKDGKQRVPLFSSDKLYTNVFVNGNVLAGTNVEIQLSLNRQEKMEVKSWMVELSQTDTQKNVELKY